MKHSSSRPAVLTLLLLAVLAAGCVMPTPPAATPVPGATSAPGATPTPDDLPRDPGAIRVYCEELSKLGKERQAQLPEPSLQAAELAGVPVEELPQMQYPPYQDLIYVEGQVLLTGQPEAINQVANTFDLKLGINSEVPPINLGEGRSIQLATIEDGLSVEDVTCMFNTYGLGQELDAAADPNYFISPAGWRGGGSPWTQNGYWASNLPGGGLGLAKPDQLLGQWALGPRGINLLKEDGSRAVEETGAGVSIAVLDTSPWRLPCLRGAPCSQRMPIGSLPAELTVWELRPANPNTCPGPDRWKQETDREAQNVNNHGLFAASLAHAVAPESTIHLMRVLEDDGCGDLYKVLQGLQLFEDYTMAASQSGVIGGDKPLTNSVVNLSLGVHQPEDARSLGLPEEVTALRDKVQHMIGLGAVVVAAAGNDSFDADPNARAPGDPNAPLAAEMPARDPQVIGVAATTADRARSCFSNMGDVGAPGGDGLTMAQVPPNPTLAAEAAAGGFTNCIVPGQVDPGSKAYWCETAGNEDACLVGAAIDPATRKPGYRYWAGTSFATPLVSGLAALKLQQGVPPDQVESAILQGATTPGAGAPFLGAGIVDASN